MNSNGGSSFFGSDWLGAFLIIAILFGGGLGWGGGRGPAPDVATKEYVQTTVDNQAIQGGIQQAGRTYEPLTYVVGQMRLIPGWEESVMGMPEGTIMQVVMPSAQAYGPQGAGKDIPPYSPLVFDI